MINKATLCIVVPSALLPSSFYLGFRYRDLHIVEGISPASVVVTSRTKEVQNTQITPLEALEKQAILYATHHINIDSPSEKINCETIQYQQGMNECSFYKVKYLTDTLKKEYDDISRIFPEVVISDRSKFAEIQTQWIAIISEECHLYARNEGGSLHPLEENGCRATLLKEKILFLRSLR